MKILQKDKWLFAILPKYLKLKQALAKTFSKQGLLLFWTSRKEKEKRKVWAQFKTVPTPQLHLPFTHEFKKSSSISKRTGNCIQIQGGNSFYIWCPLLAATVLVFPHLSVAVSTVCCLYWHSSWFQQAAPGNQAPYLVLPASPHLTPTMPFNANAIGPVLQKGKGNLGEVKYQGW